MQVEAQQIIPVKIEMEEKEAIIAILKNRGWWRNNIFVKDEKIFVTEDELEKVMSDDPKDAELFVLLASVLAIVDNDDQ